MGTLRIFVVGASLFATLATFAMSGKKPVVGDCVRSGCGGELCVATGEGIVTACRVQPWHRCYRSAVCERQSDGQCGWTSNAALAVCVRDAGRK